MNTEEYDEGWASYNNEMNMDENPYRYGSEDYYEWESGWVDAAEYAGFTYGQRL